MSLSAGEMRTLKLRAPINELHRASDTTLSDADVVLLGGGEE